MTSLNNAAPAATARQQQLSTRIGFFIAGFSIAAWAPLVPYAKARVGLNDGTLGLLLLCLGVGSIIAMPLAGMLAGRFGCRVVLIVSSVLIGICLPLLATLTSLPLLIATLFVFGASMGALDCTVNIQAIIVERASGRTMMSGFHGLFSLGGIVGAGSVAGMLSIGATPLIAMGAVVGIIAIALFKASPHFLTYGNKSTGPAFVVPHGIVLFIGLLCMTVFLTEGAMLDWSAVYLSSQRGVDPAYAGLGYAVFALTMTIGRLSGDAIVRRVGANRVIVLGGICASLGLAMATLIPAWEVTLLGYALVGAGCSNIVPVLYSAIGRQTIMPEHLAVPAVTTLGYAGILAGPAGIGFVAHASSLDLAFLGMAVLLLGVAVGGKLLKA